MGLEAGNPVVGGTILRRASIASPNFHTGVSGWSINQDGSAEFQNATVRGNVQAGSLTTPRLTIDSNGNLQILNSNGKVIFYFDVAIDAIFMYQDLGAVQGDLFISIAPTGGAGHTDPIQGRTYQEGICSYSIGATDNFTELTGNTLVLKAATELLTGLITESAVGILALESGTSAGGDTRAAMNLIATLETIDTVSPMIRTFGRIQLQDGSGNPSWIAQVDPNSPNADESFHNYTFINGWTGGGRATPGFRLQADKAEILVGGSFTVPVGFAGGQNITNSIPVQYRPNNNQSFACRNLTGNKLVFIDIASGGGALQFAGPAANAVAGDIIDMPFSPVALSR